MDWRRVFYHFESDETRFQLKCYYLQSYPIIVLFVLRFIRVAFPLHIDIARLKFCHFFVLFIVPFNYYIVEYNSIGFKVYTI
jgi:hypothetical protein